MPDRILIFVLILLSSVSACLYGQKMMELRTKPQPSQPKRVGTFFCSPETLYTNDTLVLHLPNPHGSELILRTPSKTLFFLAQNSVFVDDSEAAALFSGKEFLAMTELKFPVKSFEARPYVAHSKKEKIFRQAGKYVFEMSNNLEDDSGVRGDTTSVLYRNMLRKR